MRSMIIRGRGISSKAIISTLCDWICGVLVIEMINPYDVNLYQDLFKWPKTINYQVFIT